jgi:hypothetical protein
MVSTGNFLRLPGDDTKDYLRIVHHREVATTKWECKFPLEVGRRIWKVFSSFLLLPFFSLLFTFYIENNNNKEDEGKEKSLSLPGDKPKEAFPKR